MNVLVTGGTGFLGKALAFRLQNEGYCVTALGRNELMGENLRKSGIEFLKADLSDKEYIEKACEGKEYVFHCGALSSPWGKYEEFYNTNVVGTNNVVAGCKKHKVKRLIYVSTPSIYFYFNDRLGVKENDPLPQKFANHYAETKYLAEKEIDNAHLEGLPVITIRPRALFGPGDTTILPRLIKTNEKRFVPFINGGEVLMDLTYVENVVDALLLCMSSPDTTLGKKYNITNGEPVIFKEVLEKVFFQLGQSLKRKDISFSKAMKMASILEWISKYLLGGKEPLLTKYTVSVLAKNQTLNIDLAKSELGYVPSISIEDGISLFVEWWKTKEVSLDENKSTTF